MQRLKKDVLKMQAGAIKTWRSRTDSIIIKVDSIEIIVSPKVFEPKPDSILLAKKMGIKPGEIVLDTCAGSGIQTIYAATVKGAGKVYSCDINPYAVANIKLNVRKHNLGKIVKVFRANLFPEGKTYFDVIVSNPPYTDHKSKDIVEKSVWDEKHKTLKHLLKDAPKYLKPEGKMYISWANFADFGLFEKLARVYKYHYRKIASRKDPADSRIEYRVYKLIPQ
jgi:methylase of polypeptide subunit release factors